MCKFFLTKIKTNTVMKPNLLMLMASSALCFAACGNKDDIKPVPEPQPESTKWEIKIAPSIPSTKASDFGFENGDCTGLYVVNYSDGNPGSLLSSGNHVDNMRFTYSGLWTPDSPVYWKDKETYADFYLYYPYRQISDVTAIPIETNIDQSKESNYKGADFMIGKTSNVAPTDEAVSISTSHVLSRVCINLAAGNGFTDESLRNSNVSVKINGLRTKANVNLASSVISLSGDKSSVTPYKYGNVFKAIVLPQTVENGDLITVNVDGKDFNLKKGFTFEANKEHTFTVTVSKTSNGINVNINPWETDGTDNGGVAE